MRLALAQGQDRAARQKAPELGLLWGPADLGEDRCWNQWKSPEFQPGFMLCPCPPLAAIRGHENGRVVDEVHAGRRTVRFFWSGARSCARTRRRASLISSAVNRPC